MRYNIRIVPAADRELLDVPAFYRREIADTIQAVLGSEPMRESRARIKRLRQPATSVYRLRVGDYRVFYDVDGQTVTILHIRHKTTCGELYGGAHYEN